MAQKDIDWFEKQREQKPANKVEPKFKAGDWVVSNRYTSKPFCITKICDTHYLVDNDSFIPFEQESDWRLWTIQDAKDGDILFAKDSYFKEYIFIYSGMTEDNVMSTYCGFDMAHNNFDTKLSRFGRMEDFEAVFPVTKEQRGLLFQKMKEEGYEWDDEKKELKKIEQTSADETPYPETLEKAIDLYYYSYGNGKGEFEHLSLEKFRDIVLTFVSDYGQKPAWSEEDEKMLDIILNDINYAQKNFSDSKLTSYDKKVEWLKNKLKSLRPQNKYAYNPYKAVVESIAEMCKHYDKASHSGLRDFYDNVKVKCKDAKEYDSLYPQSTWKPSDEQMKALNEVLYHVDDDIAIHIPMLIRDLKKLKG